MTEETPKAQVFTDRQQWLAAAMQSDLVAFEITINGQTTFGIAANQGEMNKVVDQPRIVRKSKSDVIKMAAKEMAAMVLDSAVDGETGGTDG